MIATLDGSPVYIAHERGNIRLRIGTELDVIGMFVHVESKDRNAAGDALGMVGGADIDQVAIARHVGKKDPSGVTAEGLRKSDELASPPINRAEITRNRDGDQLSRSAPIAPKAREIKLVKQCRIEEHCLLLLQAADDTRRGCPNV